MTLASSTFQVKIGIRNMVIPGARRQMIVVTKLTPDKMVPRPDRTRPMIHRSLPMPGEYTELVSGRLAVPKAGPRHVVHAVDSAGRQ